jgi:hypothetical protein
VGRANKANYCPRRAGQAASPLQGTSRPCCAASRIGPTIRPAVPSKVGCGGPRLLGSVRYLRNILRDVVGADLGLPDVPRDFVGRVGRRRQLLHRPAVAFRSGAERAIEHTTFDQQFALIKPSLNCEGGASIAFRNVVEGRATARRFGRLASAQRVSPGAAGRGRDRWRSAAGSGMDWQNPRDERGFAVP